MIFTPPAKSYAGYIFDCDGTLADSMPLHLRAWNHGLKAGGAPFQLDGSSFMSVAGMALQQTIDHWNETHSLQIDAETVIAAKNAYYHEHHAEIGPIPGVVEFALSCRDAGAAISVASGGERTDVLKTLQLIGLEGVFPVIVTANDVKRAKPAPDLFILAAEKMGIPPGHCLVLEDSLLGIEAADIAGMESILIPHNLD
jgi:HAD superfamily hydrolase (TIGR01509 family)